MNGKENLILDLRDRPPILIWIMLSFQHVFAMFGATVLVPRLVNEAIGTQVLSVAVAIFCSGLGTITYIICTKAKSPIYLGSSFAFIAPMIAAYGEGGIGGITAGILLASSVYAIFAVIIHFSDSNWVRKLLPDEVVGPMIMIIGLGLAGSAISQIGMNAGGEASLKNIAVGLLTLLAIIVLSLRAPGFLKLIPILCGIIIGYLISIPLGLVDFSGVAEAKWIAIPDFVLPYKDYQFDFKAGLTMMAVALVTISEHIGDHVNMSNTIGKDLLEEPGLKRTLLGDLLASILAALLGGPSNTSYGENLSVVGMTKVASVWVTGGAAVIAMLLSCCGKFAALIDAIPSPVLGGASVMMYGYIAASGLRLLVRNKVDFSNMRIAAIAATMLVFGLGNAEWHIPVLDISFSGMSLAVIFGVVLNKVLPAEIRIDTESAWVQKIREKVQNPQEE